MPICIPRALGVPGFSNQPPYWLPGHPSFSQNKNLDDPRWRGAFRWQGNGGVFRALHHIESGDTSLYLSWRAPFVGDLNDAHDVVYVGLRPDGGDTAMVIKIQVHTGETTLNAENAHAISVLTKTKSGGTWPTGGWTSATEPTWIDANTRVWLDPGSGTGGSYTVQMRVPITTATTLLDHSGPPLGTAFELWFALRGANPGPIPVIEEEYPNLGTTLFQMNTNDFPSPESGGGWARASTDPADSACTTAQGIDIEYLDIGTTNPSSNEILYDSSVPLSSRPVNTLYARPRNYTGATIDPNQLTARFRMANWGSIATPTTWTDVPGGGAVKNSVSIPDLPTASPPPATNTISFTWQLDDADIAQYTAGTTHRCILVELDGPFTFLNESVYRNMDFESASVMRREAEINIAGLSPIPGGGPKRDVYLAVETRNMPAHVEGGEQGEPELPDVEVDAAGAQIHVSRERQEFGKDRVIALAKQGQVPLPKLEGFMPTYRVHVYHDTGERVTEGTHSVPVLRPQTYFGHYLEHEGALDGWENRLEAPADAELKKLAPDFYQIVVPEGGATRITTVIEARETPRRGCMTAVVELLRRLLSRVSSP